MNVKGAGQVITINPLSPNQNTPTTPIIDCIIQLLIVLLEFWHLSIPENIRKDKKSRSSD